MWRRSRSDRRRRVRGFSLAEALVSLIMIVIIMSVTMSLLFSMKSFAERQQVFMAPRQQARRAMEYLKFYVAGAGDANDRAPALSNPSAIISRYGEGTQASPGSPIAAAYNNLTTTQAASGFGTEGTDVISLAIPANPMKIQVIDFPGHATNTTGQLFLNFRAGCAVNDATNMNEFKKYTGAFGTPGSEKSGLLKIVNSTGDWEYLQIVNYNGSNCSATDDHVVTATYKLPTVSQYTRPDGFAGIAGGTGISLIAGTQWISFRHRNNAIEQKIDYVDAGGNFRPGWFDPSVDGDPANSRFTRILENIDDFQVSYVFPYGTVVGNANTVVANGSAATSLPTAQNGTPNQANTTPGCGAGNLDAGCVVALRISVVARTGPLRLEALDRMERALLRRPASEDRAQGPLDTEGTGFFQRYRMTSTMIIRNRLLGY